MKNHNFSDFLHMLGEFLLSVKCQYNFKYMNFSINIKYQEMCMINTSMFISFPCLYVSFRNAEKGVPSATFLRFR